MERELDSPSSSDSADVGKTCTLFQRLKHLFTIHYLLMAMLLGFSAMQASYCIFIFCKYDGMNKYMYSRHVLLAYRLTFQPRNYCQSWAIKKLLGKIFYLKFLWFLSDKREDIVIVEKLQKWFRVHIPYATLKCDHKCDRCNNIFQILPTIFHLDRQRSRLWSHWRVAQRINTWLSSKW